MADPAAASPSNPQKPGGFLAWIEWAGNKLPDPAMLFVWALLITWGLSALLAPVEFADIDPRTRQPIAVKNQLEGAELVAFLRGMVTTFVTFPPLGVVLVALLGVGVAEHTGFINSLIKGLLRFTPTFLLTPVIILVGIVSHSAGDTGYVLVIPLGGVIFYAAGRHPLAGIAAAFAAVSGGFSANFIPSALDPLLQGFTQSAAQIIDPARTVNPLCNWYFMAASSVLIVLIGWFITDRIVEPRLKRDTPIDGDVADIPRMDALTPAESRGVLAGLVTILVLGGLLVLACLPAESAFRVQQGPHQGELSAHGSPLMDSIVPLIFLLFLVPGVIYGVVAGTVTSHRDVVKGMTKSMGTMGYYLVLAFFAAQFTYAFRESNLGALCALKGAALLRALNFPAEATIIGVILMTTAVNLLIGSASAKWALLGPIFVPMLMQLGLSPELTQAAYRVGDSSTNIITPLMPYFPLVVAFAQRYVKNTGIGTLIAMMIGYSMSHLILWSAFLLFYWKVLGAPLGPDAPYTYGP
jgi:aminobenzoyl-glutamate transport protein